MDVQQSLAKSGNASFSGTTATVALIGPFSCQFAHAGDSKAVLFEIGEIPEILFQTREHTPSLPEERSRIEAHGGSVADVAASYRGAPQVSRVFFKGENFPGLAMSRSIGDVKCHEIGVTEEPEVQTIDFGPSLNWWEPFRGDGCHSGVSTGCNGDSGQAAENLRVLVIASDGLWDVVPIREVGDVVAQHGRKNRQNAADELMALASSRWTDAHGISDDVSVLVHWISEPVNSSNFVIEEETAYDGPFLENDEFGPRFTHRPSR
jgi:serine/threonine protein phosphatase PrpC